MSTESFTIASNRPGAVPISNNDPAKLSGTGSLSEPTTINMKEYQWNGVGSPLPNYIRHLQIKITLNASDTVKNEIYALALV